MDLLNLVPVYTDALELFERGSYKEAIPKFEQISKEVYSYDGDCMASLALGNYAIDYINRYKSALEWHKISKTTFLLGLQCSKAFYLNRYYPKLKDPITYERQQAFDEGHKFGMQCHELFPDGLNVSTVLNKDFRLYPLLTESLLKKHNVIYEAGFRYDDVLVLSDIVVKSDSGLHIYEVKNMNAVSETILFDAALQYYIINKSGYNVAGFNIVLNKEGRPFIKNITIEAKENLKVVTEFIKQQKETLESNIIPDVKVGDHCYLPYKCPFIGYCSGIGVTGNYP